MTESGTLRQARQTRYDRTENALAAPMLVLALIFLPVLVLPLAWPTMPRDLERTLSILNILIWAAFVLEYVVLFALAVDRRRYFRTHLLDLALVALPMLRPLRVLRAGIAAGRAAVCARRRLVVRAALYAPLAAMLFAALAAAFVLDAERGHDGANIHNYGDATWWALTTLTTVGYGDRYPVTAEGRVFAAGLMVVGIALLGVVTASIAAAFVRWTDAVEAEVRGERVELADILTEMRALRAEVAELRGR